MAGKEIPSASVPVKNIVLVGRRGNGKSATGNTLLGDNMFISKRRAGGVTMECQMRRALMQDGPIINVIDTPGLVDSEVSAVAVDLNKEIIKCLILAEEGIHAFLFVLSVSARISQEEESALKTLQLIFESKILDYFIFVFTGGDLLEHHGMTFDDYLNEFCPEFLTRVLRPCGGRKVLFENRTFDKDKKDAQLNQLLAHIADIEMKTGGKPYTANMHRKIKEENEKVREQERVLESENLGEPESKVMHEKLQMEHEKNMKMMSQAVEDTLKQSAAAHEREMRLVEDALKKNAAAHEREMRIEREMRQMRDEFHQSAIKQNADAHEREIRLRDEHNQAQQRIMAQQLQQAQQLQMLPERQGLPGCRCSIM